MRLLKNRNRSLTIMGTKEEQITYKEWFKKIVWLREKVVLPDGKTICKLDYTTKDGFEIDGFNSLLFKLYNKQNPVSDGRRYKK